MFSGDRMNVYDFDGTIYDGDSSIDFYLFCIKKKPVIFWKSIFNQLSGAVLFKLGIISRKRFKEKYFCFLKRISIDDALLNEFWNQKYSRVKAWYLKQKKSDDLVISASPEFLLRPVCEKLGVSLIASEVDILTGHFEGENCRGEEKVRRFQEQFPDGVIERFYTDSKADLPLMRIAKEAFFVQKQTVIRYCFDGQTKS